jgi:hypothetical protein
METGNVNLSISKEIVNPIVEAKIKAAVIEAMGGTDLLINKVVDQVLNQNVGHDGKISQYSSDNKSKWIDVVVTNQIRESVKVAMAEILATRQEDIKAAIMKQLSSKKGIEAFAQALLSGYKLDDKYKTNIDIKFEAVTRWQNNEL